MEENENFKLELGRIRQTYAQFEQKGLGETIWAPFNETEAAYRSQEFLAMAECFRKVSRLSLQGLKILDVGCGNGRILRSFVDMGADPADLIGVDLLSDRIEQAKRLSPHLHFEGSSGISLGFEDEQFDLVTQFVVFSSIKSAALRQRLASEMVRVLRRGGFIYWWDMVRLAPSCGEGRLPVEPLFLSMDIAHELYIGKRPSLRECVRYVSVVKKLLSPLLDWLSYPVSHRAILLGPKPNHHQ